MLLDNASLSLWEHTAVSEPNTCTCACQVESLQFTSVSDLVVEDHVQHDLEMTLSVSRLEIGSEKYKNMIAGVR